MKRTAPGGSRLAATGVRCATAAWRAGRWPLPSANRPWPSASWTARSPGWGTPLATANRQIRPAAVFDTPSFFPEMDIQASDLAADPSTPGFWDRRDASGGTLAGVAVQLILPLGATRADLRGTFSSGRFRHPTRWPASALPSSSARRSSPPCRAARPPRVRRRPPRQPRPS